MSQEARDKLVGALVFQKASQKSDLDSTALTHTELIALLTYLVFDRGWPIEITAVRTDHHDDSGLSWPPEYVGSHAHGWAVDCWPLNTLVAGDYVDASNARFQRFLDDCRVAPYLDQIGLAGTAWSTENANCAGPTAFHDDGADHIHLGSQP